MPRLPDLTGRTFERLTVIGKTTNKRPEHYRNVCYLCRCACGKEIVVRAAALCNGDSTSCGCRHRDIMTKHGACADYKTTKEYQAWYSMLRRCYYPKYAKYHNYGGRGITVVEQWHHFENFLADMGPCPTKNHSLDRIDNDGPYAPANCRWADSETQQRNKRTTTMLTIGDTTLPVIAWAKMHKINHHTLRSRIKDQWPLDRILDPPFPRGARRPEPCCPPRLPSAAQNAAWRDSSPRPPGPGPGSPAYWG
jgi:hypothetical protein